MEHVSEAVDLIDIQIRPWRENPMPVHENRIMIKIENVNDSETTPKQSKQSSHTGLQHRL